jgi:acetoin utilization deacetylase AcuC-like enzyme
MAKYRLLYELLVAEGLAGRDNVHISSPCPRDLLALAHDLPYVDRFLRGALTAQEQKRAGLIWSEPLVQRTLTAVGGTLLTCRLAREAGIACHLAGGTHHAFAGHGQGFCIFNDIAVAARHQVEVAGLRRVLILDCDVHQGDGSAAILADDPRCFTCSIHGAKNYPFEKQRSDLDVPLPCGTGDDDYLEALEQTLATLASLPRPDLIIYDGGSDVHADDRLGRLALSTEGMAQRDRRVLEWAHRLGVPVACLIGGGYDHDHHRLVQRHAVLVRTADRVYRERIAPQPNPLPAEGVAKS